jgi:hypothetical protein
MAGSSGFSVIIGISDKASAGLDKINKQIAALTAPAQRFNKSLAKFGDVTGINRAAEGMATLGDRTLGTARAMERLVSPMTFLTSAASIGGIAELSKRWSDAGASIGRAAYSLNTPAQTLGAFRGAARLAGVSADAVNSSFQGLSDTIHEAFYGGPGGAEARTNLEALHVHWANSRGEIAKNAGCISGTRRLCLGIQGPAHAGPRLDGRSRRSRNGCTG